MAEWKTQDVSNTDALRLVHAISNLKLVRAYFDTRKRKKIVNAYYSSYIRFRDDSQGARG